MKFMNMKRFASTVMAGVLTLSLATPAFATGNVVITGTYADIEIAVEVPTTGTAQINPYGLPVTIDKSDRTSVDLVDQKITTQPMSIKNQSSIPLEIGASVTAVPKGDVEIKQSVAAADKGKQISLELQVAALNDSALAVATTDRTLEDKLIDKFAAEATWASLATSNKGAFPAAAKGATTAPTPESYTGLATVGAATIAGNIITYGPKSIALFRLDGFLNEAPEKAGGAADPWATADGFEATVAFTFKPAAKLNVTMGTITGGTATASASKAWEGTEITLTGTPTTAGQTATFTVAATTASDATGKPAIVVTKNGNTSTFTMPDYPVTITATFAA